jgi:outer membrane protein TolC
MFVVMRTRAPLRLRPAAACAALAALLAAGVAAEPLDLAEAERLAIERDPALTRLEAEAKALSEAAVAAGQLPDPELTLGYQNLPVDGFPTTDDMMTMAMIGVRQQFPAGRTRHLRRDRGELEAAARRAERDHRALEVKLETRRAWLDWRFAHDAAAVAHDAAAEFDELIALTERRLAAGTARQRDLSQAKLEWAALNERIIEIGADLDTAAAELSRWLGEPVSRQLVADRTAARTPGAAPDWPLPEHRVLRDALGRHPALEVLDLQSEASRVGVDIARQAYRPMWMVELGYGYRRGTDMATGERRSDMITGMVSVSLPLFRGQRQNREVRAAEFEQDAAQYARADMLRVLDGALQRQLAAWTRLDALVGFYRDELLPEASQLVTTTESAYRSDRASFDELIRARVDQLDYRLRAMRVARSRDDARIELLYLAGDRTP